MKLIVQITAIIATISSTLLADESLTPLPAVSGVNGKLDYSGGWMESAEGHNISGSITAPITTHFGIQGDGLFTHVSHRDFFGGAGHFFWRDPSIGLLGVGGGGVFSDKVLNSYQGVVEGECYFNRFTVSALAGVGHISYDVKVPFRQLSLIIPNASAHLPRPRETALLPSTLYETSFGDQLYKKSPASFLVRGLICCFHGSS